MTIEDQIRTLLEKHDKADKEAAEQGSLPPAQPADDETGEPAVKIENPIDPTLQVKTPDAEIAAAESDSDEDKEDDEDSKEKDDVKESTSLDALLSEDFSDEFKLKAQTIFEAAVKEQVAKVKSALREEHNAAVAKLEEQFEDKLALQRHQVQEEMSEKIDGYLGFLAEEWKEDNIIALEAGIKSELTESFIGALKQVFETHYVDVPTDKVDLYHKVLKENADMKANLSTSFASAQQLREEVAGLKRADIIEESVKGLTELDAERLRMLVEDFEYVDAAIFEKKVQIVKTQFFDKRAQSAHVREQMENELKHSTKIIEVREPIQESVTVDPAMAAYVEHLRK